MIETLMERYERAQMYFDAKDFVTASTLLDELVEDVPDETAVRVLLARAYFHSAQLHRAERELRIVLDRDPVDDYAHLLLGRTLERQSRHGEAARHLRIAEAMTGESSRRILEPVD
ncbi:tetratricopeptide repeat protein [Pseudonocardia spinosispora]|uniref:tetratricopeptide repeat protein n=1 Tax=Pseudonocardia spinosispora TaxID=103441 RepID=UPI00041EC0F4|nr:tetratricopeptide repeat protein [Pseudonocardia spinosispora]